MSTVTRYPSTDTAVTGTWSNPTSVQADDIAFASVTSAASKNVDAGIREQGGFGFDGQIPAGSTINSVALQVGWHVSTTGGIANLGARLRVGSTDGTEQLDTAEPTTSTDRSYTTMARPGGGSWTRDDLLDGTLKTRLRGANGNSATAVTYLFDYVRVVVDYTSATVPGTPTIVSVTPGDTTITVVFDPPASDGGASIIEYEALEELAGFAQSLSDSVTLSDARVVGVGKSLADTTSPTDALAFSTTQALVDAATVGDAQTTSRGLSTAPADSATLTDARFFEAGKGAALGDSVTPADALIFFNTEALADTASAADATTLEAARAASIGDSATAPTSTGSAHRAAPAAPTHPTRSPTRSRVWAESRSPSRSVARGRTTSTSTAWPITASTPTGLKICVARAAAPSPRTWHGARRPTCRRGNAVGASATTPAGNPRCARTRAPSRASPRARRCMAS